MHATINILLKLRNFSAKIPKMSYDIAMHLNNRPSNAYMYIHIHMKLRNIKIYMYLYIQVYICKYMQNPIKAMSN